MADSWLISVWRQLPNLGGLAITVLVVVILLRMALGHFLTRNVETHKAELRVAGDRAVEAYKAHLRAESDRELEKVRADLKAQADRATEAYKADLKAAGDREMEHLRASIKRDTTEHEVRFRKLHDKVADVLTGLYERLSAYHNRVGDYVLTPGGLAESIRDRHMAINQAAKDFYEYFWTNLVFVPKPVRKLMEEYGGELLRVAQVFTREHAGRDNYDQEQRDKAATDARNRLAPLFENIYDQLQRTLGFDYSEPPARPR